MDRERNQALEDYWQEFRTFADSHPEEDEDDASKTPDEGEAEEEWLREAGFQTLVDTELTEDDQGDSCEDVLATLTPRQIAVVKKHLETFERSKKRRFPAKQRAHVRDLFNNITQTTSTNDQKAEPERQNSSQIKNASNYGQSRAFFKSATAENTDWAPTSRVVRPLPFLRTGHSGGFKLKDHSGAIDSESPTSVEVLKYETRVSVVQENESYSPDSGEDGRELSNSECSLEPGFQEISSRLNSVDEQYCQEWLKNANESNSHVACGELIPDDRYNVRTLALIEVSALLDSYGLVPSRRKRARKKNKDSTVFGASLVSLFDMDQKRCPGCKIPLLYQWIFHHLRTKGLREEGLMRLGGSVQKTEVLKAEIERNYQVSPNLVENVVYQASVHDVAVILKQLIRYLPEPLLTLSHMDAFLQVPNILNIQDQINALNLLVLVLPDAHRGLLQELLSFLGRVIEEEPYNRMTIQNVAMIMAPNLFPPKVKKGNLKNDLAAEMTVAALSSKVTQLLIKYRKHLGLVPSELLAQARLQKRRSLSDKHIRRPLGRKTKIEKTKSIKDDSHSPSIIQVHIASMHYYSIPVMVNEGTTAGDVVEKVAEAVERMMDPLEQENRGILEQRPRTLSEPIMIQHRCLLGTKKHYDCLKSHYLYQTRENIGDRMLDHSCRVLGIGWYGHGSTWEIRCHH